MINSSTKYNSATQPCCFIFDVMGWRLILSKMVQINLELPIKIRKTVGKDGYVITDANDVEHFFYEKEKEEMEYDGFCAPVKK